MKNLPSLNAHKVIKALKKCGFVQDRQRGSHLVHSGKTIKKPLLQSIIEDDAGMTVVMKTTPPPMAEPLFFQGGE
ncbi:hypothetical protein A3F59_02785 [Candidatus Roizmanbacteria bacterium RIFCSPHIGHO2_12_FULL_38_13]|nr:MAG: hypothetical protein A3F59_02785 [Candidatus Roizmanbacteria bacterium RIFCSPHIGHO2_12_FULL_38_13]